jgi:hypothetical protein
MYVCLDTSMCGFQKCGLFYCRSEIGQCSVRVPVLHVGVFYLCL